MIDYSVICAYKIISFLVYIKRWHMLLVYINIDNKIIFVIPNIITVDNNYYQDTLFSVFVMNNIHV